MDDHFAHGSLIPSEPTTHKHRRVPVLIAVAVVLILGALVAIYWKKLVTFPSLFSSDSGDEIRQESPPPTIEEKVKLLEGESSAPTASSPPPDTKAALLEEEGRAASAPASQLSADEKAKLLGGQ